ncbi:hypothetical protein KY285_010268 [Solanum tuberosum]|nr:hypothetical protein KY289_010807 [Solanum tuberosum]KAH0734561.1 hypothetical protein KY285_010268 [Solanum tuberosum]
MWRLAPNYKAKIKESWEAKASRRNIFQLVGKLYRLKKVLLCINKEKFGDIERKAEEAKEELRQCQLKLRRNPTNNSLIDHELEITKKYGKFKEARDQFLKQKTKIQWIQEGDQNTKFYHNYIKARRNTNRVFAIKDKYDERQERMEGISKAFLAYYKELIGQSNMKRKHVCREILMNGPMVNEEQCTQLKAMFTENYVKEAIWSIDGNKSPGPDGYVSQFFKDNWEIVVKDVVKGVMEFFRTKKILTGMNNTTITLIPKGSHADTGGDY